jgi:hypothetical protein
MTATPAAGATTYDVVLLADLGDVELGHRQGRCGHRVAGGERAQRRLDPGRSVLDRDEQVVTDLLVGLQLLVERDHLARVDLGECLLGEQDHVVRCAVSHGNRLLPPEWHDDPHRGTPQPDSTSVRS